MMTKFPFLLAALLLALSLPQGTRAAVDEDTPIPADQIAPLAAWVEQATHVSIPALPITTASNRRLKNALNLEGVSHARAAAAYLPGQIVINNVLWEPESVQAQSYLVHELVHHTQLISRKSYPCAAAKEREAYMMQNQWLVEHGQAPLVDQDWIDHISSCAADDEHENMEH